MGLAVKLLVVELRGSSVLCFGVEEGLILVEENLPGILKDICLPTLHSDNPAALGVLDHPPDIFVVIQVIPEGNIPMRITEGSPHEFDGFVVFFE